MSNDAMDAVAIAALADVDGNAREWALAGLDFPVVIGAGVGWKQPLENLFSTLHAAGVLRRMSWRCTPVNIDKLVDDWHEVIVALSTAHDPEERDRADERTDELLTPLLTAPIKQVRQFSSKLAKALREDERVPFIVWSAYQRVVEPLVKTAPEGKVIELKTTLAREVAELAERDIDRAELIAAMAGALQWRSADTLKAVKGALEQGEKPRLKGRESCLFLHAGNKSVML